MQKEIYEERARLMKTWFYSWEDFQQQQFLRDLVSNILNKKQKDYLHGLTKSTCIDGLDFTRRFPQAITLYVFSFLDPRSLCRCSQVCWYWKWLSERNELWMNKCVAIGWNLPVNSPLQSMQTGQWKQLFRQNFQRLRQLSRPVIKYSYPTLEASTMTEHISPTHDVVLRPQEGSLDVEFIDLQKEERKQRPKSVSVRTTTEDDLKPRISSRPSSVNISHMQSIQNVPQDLIQLGKKHPPWRSSNRKPRDLVRYNYLENDNIIWELGQERMKMFGKYLISDT